jgi:tetratricopeptide (TPR) repeat protein
VVYLAEQEEPVRRRVALKIIKLGMETRSVIARFEAERQALAMMDHPNIARVFDAGATDRGLPYFVMELVRGVRITEFADQHALGPRERIHLFVEVCHAIQHAHQKGIIHGDIKPSNIMVTHQDGVAVPKVIDFGISKATEARLTDKLFATAFAQLIGTPAYMSPEQAEMAGRDIDTRSDIYSLGVLLYELLTGRTPFDPKELTAAGLDGLRRTLRETEPPRPSLMLSTLTRDELGVAAGVRRDEPQKLISLLRGDLDWIVMKALEKDRARRYETANGLAMDLQRHLNNEPVIARPPSRLYRFSKLVRRNRVVFAAGGAVVLALMAGTGTSTWLLLKEREARQRAVAAEQQQARLRIGAELREKVTQAALLVSQERQAEADQLLEGVRLEQPTVEGAAVFRALGEWHALQGRWRQSAERFATVLGIDQLDGLDGTTLDYLRWGPALVELGDTSGYERFREGAIARFARPPGQYADRIVKISLLLPANPKAIAALGPFGDAMGKSLADAEAAGDGFMAAWRSVSIALWEYRRGNFAEAAEWSRRCLSYKDFNNAPRNATARAILAMAYFHLGRGTEAEAELARGSELIENKFKNRLDRGTPIQGFWFDWLFARILMREAAALIESASLVP